jgi:hypothetical protein
MYYSERALLDIMTLAAGKMIAKCLYSNNLLANILLNLIARSTEL